MKNENLHRKSRGGSPLFINESSIKEISTGKQGKKLYKQIQKIKDLCSKCNYNKICEQWCKPAMKIWRK